MLPPNQKKLLMPQSLSPVPIYSQFFDTPLPDKTVRLLENWNRYYVLKFLISLKLAAQHISTEAPHELITILLAFLPNHRPPKYGPIDKTRITSKTVVLQIIADLLASDSNEKNDSEVLGNAFYQDCLTTILIYNEHQFSNIGIGIDSKKLKHTDVWRIGLMQDLNAENPATYSRIGGIKQLIYVQFLKKQFGKDYPEFELGVIEYTGISSIVEIALLFIHLQVAFDQAIKNRLPMVVIGPSDNIYELLHKLELVIDASSGTTIVSVAQMSTAPFLKLKDNNLYLLGTSDFDLITTKSWDYYLVKNKLFKKFLPKVASVHDLKAEWGKIYVESFLGLRIFKSLEKAGLRILSSDDKNLPDATIIVNEKDVFMIEIKSSAMDHKVVSTQYIDGFQNFIDKNFATDKKGVPQLNRSIEHLSKNAGTIFKLRNPPKKLRVYPIIIYTEPHLTKQAVNDYVNSVAPALPPDIRGSFQVVEKVTLIPMNFFLENIRLLQEDRSLLRKLITEYHTYVKTVKFSSEKKNHYLNYFSAMTSFEAWSIGKYNMYQDDTLKIFDTLREIFEVK